MTATGIKWTEITKDREYLVETPIGDFDVWQFGGRGAWFVEDCDTGESVYQGKSFEHAVQAITAVVEGS